MDITAVLHNLASVRQRDEEFLHLQGWHSCPGETCKLPGYTYPCGSIWKNQDGTKYPLVYVAGVRNAIEVAEDEYLEQCGWKEIRVRTHYQRTAFEASWYIHPKTKRIFSRKDAAAIARCFYNDEEVMCLLTNRLNEIVEGNRLREGDLVCLDCIDGVYSLW